MIWKTLLFSAYKKGDVSKVILRFFEHYLELIFIEKKNLKLHYTVEFEVLSFENGDVPLSCKDFCGSVCSSFI